MRVCVCRRHFFVILSIASARARCVRCSSPRLYRSRRCPRHVRARTSSSGRARTPSTSEGTNDDALTRIRRPDPSRDLPSLKCQPKPVRHPPSHRTYLTTRWSAEYPAVAVANSGDVVHLWTVSGEPGGIPLDHWAVPDELQSIWQETMRKKRRHAAGVPGQNPLPGASLRRARAAHHDRSGACERREAGGYSQGGNTHHGTVELVGMEHHPKRQRRTR